MTVGITSTLQFIAGNSAQYMKPNDRSQQSEAANGAAAAAARVASSTTFPDTNNNNNNNNEMEDDLSVSNKDIDSYLKHYNRWQQSGWGRTLSNLLKQHLGYEFDAEIKWNNVFMIGIFHVIAVCSFLYYVLQATLVTYLWAADPF
uniref:Uncharacterized protein n=1 Tax=Anopheles maculatus TaxID=74869 RepID=A0A182SDQ3_9DIPT